jgi:hypothetical protein
MEAGVLGISRPHFPFIFEHDFEATDLESGLASKLMLGGGRCSEQGAAGGAGGGSPISLLSMRRRDVEMRMQEGSRRLSGTRTARKYQSATGTQTESGGAMVTAGWLWDTGKGPRGRVPCFSLNAGCSAGLAL